MSQPIISPGKIQQLSTELPSLESGLAIVVDGDKAPRAISKGQYLFIKNHSTLATGGYHATAAISSGANVAGSVAADEDGICNNIKNNLLQIRTSNQSITNAASGYSEHDFNVSSIFQTGDTLVWGFCYVVSYASAPQQPVVYLPSSNKTTNRIWLYQHASGTVNVRFVFFVTNS